MLLTLMVAPPARRVIRQTFWLPYRSESRLRLT